MTTERRRRIVLVSILLAPLLILLGDLLRRGRYDDRLREELPSFIDRRVAPIPITRSHNGRIRVESTWPFALQPGLAAATMGDFLVEGEPLIVQDPSYADRVLTDEHGNVLRVLANPFQSVAPVTWYGRWHPRALPRDGRDLLLVFDHETKSLQALDLLNDQKAWQCPIPGNPFVQGDINLLGSISSTEEILVPVSSERQLHFVGVDGTLHASTSWVPEAQIVPIWSSQRAVLALIVEPDGAWRLFDARGSLQQTGRFRFPTEYAPAAIIPAKLSNGTLAIRAEYTNCKPLLYGLDGSMEVINDSERVPRNLMHYMPIPVNLLPNGGCIMAKNSIRVFDDSGRTADWTDSGLYTSMSFTYTGKDGRILVPQEDTGSSISYLSWIKVDE